MQMESQYYGTKSKIKQTHVETQKWQSSCCNVIPVDLFHGVLTPYLIKDSVAKPWYPQGLGPSLQQEAGRSGSFLIL